MSKAPFASTWLRCSSSRGLSSKVSLSAHWWQGGHSGVYPVCPLGPHVQQPSRGERSSSTRPDGHPSPEPRRSCGSPVGSPWAPGPVALPGLICRGCGTAGAASSSAPPAVARWNSRSPVPRPLTTSGSCFPPKKKQAITGARRCSGHCGPAPRRAGSTGPSRSPTPARAQPGAPGAPGGSRRCH